MQLRFKLKRCQLFVVMICCLSAAGSAFAQDGRLQMGHLNKLAGKATEAVDVTFDDELLRTMATTRSAESSDPAKFKATLSRLQGVYVKGFRFDAPGAYTEADVEVLRAQLNGPGWKRIVSVNNKRGGDNGEIYLRFQGEALVGLTVLSATPTEIYVVNAVGPIELNDISMEEGVRGLSRLDASWNSWASRWTGNRARGSRRN
ncbi:MAG: DUF4252 domain-containing protein [Blastocatellia bacterium]